MVTNTDSSRMREWIGTIGLFFLSFFLCFLILEIGIRALNLAPSIILTIGHNRFVDNPKIVYELIPGTITDNGSLINKQGFKDVDFIEKKPPNTVRIAMIGDSITQGLCVATDKTFSAQLAKILNARALELGNKTHYEVMNFGVGGYNLGAEVETLRTKVVKYDPDIVVLNLFFNDNEPIPGLGLIFLDEKIKISNKQRLWLYEKYCRKSRSFWRKFERIVLYKSRLYIYLIWKLSGIDAVKKYTTQFYHASFDNKNDDTFYTDLSEIRTLQARYGFKFIVCLHSHLFTGEHANNKVFAKTLEEFHFPYFHVFEYYKNENIKPEAIQLHKNETMHPNVLGHSIIAKAMLSELKKNGFIDNVM